MGRKIMPWMAIVSFFISCNVEKDLPDETLIAFVSNTELVTERTEAFKNKKNIWTFWDKGSKKMSAFNALNVKHWKKVQGKDWNIHVLSLQKNNDQEYVFDWIDRADLVDTFEELNPTMQSDHIRLALLIRYGGVWMDSSIILLRKIEDFCWDAMQREEGSVCGFSLKSWGLPRYEHMDAFENWFIAAKYGSAFMHLWNYQFKRYWTHRKKSVDIEKFIDYKHLDLSNLRFHDYLTQHVAFRAVIENNPEGLELFRKKIIKYNAEDRGYLHANDATFEGPQNLQFFHENFKPDWVKNILHHAYLMKFNGNMASELKKLSEEEIFFQPSTLNEIYKQIEEKYRN